jgi:hypothetical protein
MTRSRTKRARQIKIILQVPELLVTIAHHLWKTSPGAVRRLALTSKAAWAAINSRSGLLGVIVDDARVGSDKWKMSLLSLTRYLKIFSSKDLLPAWRMPDTIFALFKLRCSKVFEKTAHFVTGESISYQTFMDYHTEIWRSMVEADWWPPLPMYIFFRQTLSEYNVVNCCAVFMVACGWRVAELRDRRRQHDRRRYFELFTSEKGTVLCTTCQGRISNYQVTIQGRAHSTRNRDLVPNYILVL